MSIEELDARGRSGALAWRGPMVEVHAFAMPRCGPQGEPVVHLALRALGMVMNYNMPLEDARQAHTRLGEALRTFDVARSMTEPRLDPTLRVPSGDLATREQERLYRAKLAMRLGLEEADIRAVFDLSENGLAVLRSEVAGS